MIPRKEDQSRNGVRVIVWKYSDGSVVEVDCQCFGNPKRCHSTLSCPLLKKIMEEKSD